jgi:tetratricopeptide (TPR) repeat protein
MEIGGMPNVSTHPTSSALEAFLYGRLPAAARRAVVVHLLRGCQTCKDAMASLAAALSAPSFGEEDDGWRYEFAFRRAMRRVFSARRDVLAVESARSAAPASLLLMPARPRWHHDRSQFRRCEDALDETRRLGRSDPEGMLALAIANASFAEHLDPEAFSPGTAHDLRARAYAELGNARRIVNDFPNAEADFFRALRCAKAGTGNPMIRAEILWLAASLYRAARSFETASLLLDQAYEIYLRSGERHLAGRTLISQGIARAYAGRTLDAAESLQNGLRLADRERDPALFLAGAHNLIRLLIDEGHFADARESIRLYAGLYRQHGALFDRLRLRWLEGLIAAGLGEPAEAEVAFLEARAGFAEHRLAYVEALISLDLAALWLTQGRTAEIGALLAEVLGTFRALGIRREAIAVLLMLEEAAQAERLTASLVTSAAARLQKLEGEGGS